MDWQIKMCNIWFKNGQGWKKVFNTILIHFTHQGSMNVKLVLITLSALITLYFYNGQTIFKEKY